MAGIHLDPAGDWRSISDLLYSGDLVVLSNLPAVSEFATFAQEQLTELFFPQDPLLAYKTIAPEAMAKLLGEWKPRFIHHPVSKRLVREIIVQAGADPDSTHFDVPKPRTSFPVGHLTTGIAFAFPWHRDSWYVAPSQQLHWWLPIFPVEIRNAMEFDLAAYQTEVPNDSERFDYYELNKARIHTASQINKEVQVRPGATDYTPKVPITVLPPVGSVLLFTGAQLHASIPNTSGIARFSVDFRTVCSRDIDEGRGAPLVDVRCTGSAIRDFRKVATGEPFDECWVRRNYGEPPDDAMLVFPETKIGEKNRRLGS